MKAKILFGLLCLMPSVASAAIPYRVEQITMPAEVKSGLDSQAFARDYRFYVGGAYDFAFAEDVEAMGIEAKLSPSYEGFVGVRVFDTFRIEANYIRYQADWDMQGKSYLSVNSDIVMMNAIFDARIDNIYRLFRKQMIVPYVGLGAGVAWNSYDTLFENNTKPVFAALAGIGVELGNRFTLDFGYRYMYMTPQSEKNFDIELYSHQIRLGARLNF